jgi:hypothetical protein
MKQRIRQLFPHHGSIQADMGIPRGWITPQGLFRRTKEHWASINSHFRRLENRSGIKTEEDEEAAEAQRTAHLAYGLGWISVGHGGKLNAVGHQRIFRSSVHPAVVTLRKLLAEAPALTIPIEIQLGEYVPSRGVHEDFDLKEYCLDTLVKKGRLRLPR